MTGFLFAICIFRSDFVIFSNSSPA
uniref:Uncharacterized protein n=1 Tax=Anguilla anguilla TaxID=7936 RepID=A0A0E9UMK0_ANGAN